MTGLVFAIISLLVIIWNNAFQINGLKTRVEQLEMKLEKQSDSGLASDTAGLRNVCNLTTDHRQSQPKGKIKPTGE